MPRMSAPQKMEKIKQKYQEIGKGFDQEVKQLMNSGIVRTYTAAVDKLYRELEIETTTGELIGYYMGAYHDPFNPGKSNNYFLTQKSVVRINTDSDEFRNLEELNKVVIDKALYKKNITTGNEWIELNKYNLEIRKEFNIEELREWVSSMSNVYEPLHYAVIGYIKFINQAVVWGEGGEKQSMKPIFDVDEDNNEIFNLRLSIAEDETTSVSVALRQPNQILKIYPQPLDNDEEHIQWLRDNDDDVRLSELGAIRDEEVFVFGRGMGYISRKEGGKEIKDDMKNPFIDLNEGFIINTCYLECEQPIRPSPKPPLPPAKTKEQVEKAVEKPKETDKTVDVSKQSEGVKEETSQSAPEAPQGRMYISIEDRILEKVDKGEGTAEGIIALSKEFGFPAQDLRNEMQRLINTGLIVKDGKKFIKVEGVI